MKVTYQTCCGVDVHKSFLVATIIKTTNGFEPSYQKKRFSTFNNSILQFKNWLLENNCYDGGSRCEGYEETSREGDPAARRQSDISDQIWTCFDDICRE